MGFKVFVILRLVLTYRLKAYVTTIGSLATVLSLKTNIKLFQKFQKVQIECEHLFFLRSIDVSLET